MPPVRPTVRTEPGGGGYAEGHSHPSRKAKEELTLKIEKSSVKVESQSGQIEKQTLKSEKLALQVETTTLKVDLQL